MVQLKRRGNENFTAVHEAFPYQFEAFQALQNLEYGAVFHEQGLGKTKIGIDLGLHWLLSEIVDSVIFVTKKSLVENWVREIRSHTNVSPRVISSDRVKNFHSFNAPARFYVTHYEAIRSEEERFRLFSKTRILAIVLDEAQKIKNPASALFQSFASLSECFVRRVVMTGTPMANRPFDIWAPVYFLDHGDALGKDFAEFRENLDLSEEYARDADARNSFANRLDAIFERINDFAVRETKDSAGIKLPKKVFRIQECDWEPIQEGIYRSYVDEERHALIRNGNLIEDTADAILKKLLRLVQVASNPRTIDASYRQEPGKYGSLVDLLEMNRDHGERSIVWTTFTENADWLTKKLSEFGAVKIHGKMNMASRYRSVDAIMKSDDCWVLVATPGAAKEGLTLTRANHVIFYDRSFSLDDYLQAQDRIHRISQERECVVTNLVLPDSIDEWIDELLVAKELSARLGLGDIEREEFLSAIDFSFYSSLKRFLLGEESLE